MVTSIFPLTNLFILLPTAGTTTYSKDSKFLWVCTNIMWMTHTERDYAGKLEDNSISNKKICTHNSNVFYSNSSYRNWTDLKQISKTCILPQNTQNDMQNKNGLNREFSEIKTYLFRYAGGKCTKKTCNCIDIFSSPIN